jgi:hypothetical protein
MKEGVVFSKLIEEYGSLDAEESASAGKGEKAAIVADDQAEIDAEKGRAALCRLRSGIPARSLSRRTESTSSMRVDCSGARLYCFCLRFRKLLKVSLSIQSL